MATGESAVTFEMKGSISAPGFMPLICRLASEAGLGGWIRSGHKSVLLHLEGDEEEIRHFILHLPSSLYPAFMLRELNIVRHTGLECLDNLYGRKTFRILAEHKEFPTIRPDYTLCPDCIREMYDPSSRRYCFPFWGCRRCGPSYGALSRMPFIRRNTYLAAFPPCHKCEEERLDRKDFHHYKSELLSCRDCGPSLYLTDRNGNLLDDQNAICSARTALAKGEIVVVQSLFGGFYVLADATNRKALETLRQRRKLPLRPVSVIANNMDAVRQYCSVSAEEEALLTSPASPVVLLHLREDAEPGPLKVDSLIPDGPRIIGMELPPTALIHLLFHHHSAESVEDCAMCDPEFLAVITDNWDGRSRNPDIDVLMKNLSPVADKFLCHDLRIGLDCSSSVAAVRDGRARILRRSRGYTPLPIHVKRPLSRIVASFGGDVNSVIALGYGRQIVPSQHIGDLRCTEATERQIEILNRLSMLFDCVPEVVACDMNPMLYSSRAAQAFAEQRGLPLITVETHHAHALACMAESGLKHCLALILTNGSPGPDGTYWGAELLDVQLESFSRLATFSPVGMPSGNLFPKTALHLAERMKEAGFNPTRSWYTEFHLSEKDRAYLESSEKSESVRSHAAGSVADSFAAALRIAPEKVTYAGQCLSRLSG